MRRLVVLVAVLSLVPATAAIGADLDELLTRSQEANYSAEQIISCSTPDGVRDAVVRITQTGKDLTVSSSVTDDVEIAAGAGSWSLYQSGGLVAEAAVGTDNEKAEPLYTVAEERAVEYLGRAAMSYLLIRDGSPRAELVFDDETGALVQAVTLTIDGDTYCERRFVSLDADVTESLAADSGDTAPIDGTAPTDDEISALPEEVAGFDLLDQYEDEDGLRFAYYSDGFFSFAVFETGAGAVALPEATILEADPGVYQRVFTAGQVTYVWETRAGGMALVGDLPPDLHEAVLSSMPTPEDPGFLRRWWRNLFG